MVRYALFVMIVGGTAASSLAAMVPQQSLDLSGANVTVIEKNQAFPVVGPIVVEDCSTEDCSERDV